MKNRLHYIFYILFFIFSLPYGYGQETIQLEQLHEWAIQNYPLTKQKILIQENYLLQRKNIQSASFPQANLVAQGSWQSEVTSFPIKIPGITTEELAKDQYKLYLDVNQLIYDGGQLKFQSKIAEITSQIEQQKISVEYKKIEEKINQLYVQLFLLETQRKQILLVKQDVENTIIKIKAQVDNGTSFRSALYALQSELIKSNQREIELISAHTLILETLSSLTGKTFDEKSTFSFPNSIEPGYAEINIRPELSLFELQVQMIEKQKGLIASKNYPKLGAFAQTGYGRPGLNFLSNEFDPYFIGGVRLNWSIGSWYTTRREKQQMEIQQQQSQLQKDNYLLNHQISIQNYQQEIKRYTDLIRGDKEIIELREKIKNATLAQLEQGLITTADYIREINATDQAQQNLFYHQLQILLTKLQYQNAKGL